MSGFGVWQLRSSGMQWVFSSCLTSQMNKVSSMSEIGWVCSLTYHTKCTILSCWSDDSVRNHFWICLIRISAYFSLGCHNTQFLARVDVYSCLSCCCNWAPMSFRPVTGSCVLRKSRHSSVRQQMWPDRPESSQWRRGPWAGREVWVCFRFKPSVHEPLPEMFVKKAVAALLAKVCAEECQTKLILLKEQIFVHMCKISCLGPFRHTFTKNTNIVMRMYCL